METKLETQPNENYGSILRGLLNGVKQTANSFAKVHNLDAAYLEKVMKGEQMLTQEIIDAVENHTPLNARRLFNPEDRDKFPIQDDTEDGVIIFTAKQRESTIRTFERGPGGQKAPFYDYADTAMSKTSSFRPEWIVERYFHSGEDPDTPDWAFNKGHFEYQMTYFIGPVNFHWIDKDGKKHVRKMNTGDTNYITPFVPHTFTTRKEGEGLILAVTYGGSVASEDFQTEIKKKEMNEYVKETIEKLPTHASRMATDELNGVIITRNADGMVTKTSAYKEKEILSNVPNQSFTKVKEYDVLNSESLELDLKVDADRWGYNVGDVPVLLKWSSHSKELAPGDSFFIQPNVEHTFRKLDGEGKIVVMEIKPEDGDQMQDLALIYKYSGQEGLERVHSETKQWF